MILFDSVKPFVFLIVVIFYISACSTSRTAVTLDNMEPSTLSADELASQTPDYSSSLQTIKGSGRAIISEPGNNERVTLRFQSGRSASLITIRTGLGIEGGQILVDKDSLLIYNKVDNYAEKVSVRQSNLTSIGSLASLNMLDMFSFTLNPDDIRQIYEDRDHYVALLKDNSQITVSKSDGLILQVVHTDSRAAYSRIEYEGYAQIENFYLPRKITIFSSDGQSRATFLVQQLEVNKPIEDLTIDLPDNTPIRRLR